MNHNKIANKYKLDSKITIPKPKLKFEKILIKY